MEGRIPWRKSATRAELLRIYAEADALSIGASCGCADAAKAGDAPCCHFGLLGREPYVTEAEVAEVFHGMAKAGAREYSAKIPIGKRMRRLPQLPSSETCPLLSPEGRCTIYASRPLGCRSFFCRGHEPPKTRRPFLALARRLSDLSARAFPRGPGPRPFTSALATASSAASKKLGAW